MTNEQKIWSFLMERINNPYGVAGLMGNLYAESGLRPNNLQNSYEKSLGMTDESYTAAVDSGAYDNFVKDAAGYGLAQWTYWSRKKALKEFADWLNLSIGDLTMQLEFLWKELYESFNTSVLAVLKNAKTVKEASDVVLTKYERPADQSDAAKAKRAGYGQTYYDKYASTGSTDEQEENTMTCTASKVLAVAAAEIGYLEKATNAQLDDKTANAGHANYTKYARDFDQKYPKWYNGKKNGFAWCDMFVDWCFLTAFGYEKALALLCQPERSTGAGCTYSAGFYRQKGQFYTKDPKPGDQIFFGTSISDCSHTGIVEKVDGSKVYTIEGNTSDQVARRSYALTYNKIVGYGRPKYDAEEAPAPAPDPDPTPAPSTQKTVDELAQEVIAGKWGNGAERKQRLTAAGYDYAAVQARVNEILKGQAATQWTPAVGDTVIYKGTRHYSNANAITGPTCKPGKAKITQIYRLGQSKHPYHLIAVSGGGSTVYGWVDEGSFTKA